METPLRSIHVVAGVLTDVRGRVLLARRGEDSDLSGLWEFPGGKREPGESSEAALARELHEELGIAGVPLREHGRFHFAEPGNRLWGAVFSAVSDAPLLLQPEEVLEARFIAPQQALAEAQAKPYCPDSLQALRLYLAS